MIFIDYSHDFNNKKCRGSVLLRSAGGDLFRRAMEKIGWTWQDYHLTNAMWGDSEDALTHMEIPEEWKGKRTKVIALGEKASEVLEQRKIVHATIPHPSWWNRFKQNEPITAYVNLIMEALGKK